MEGKLHTERRRIYKKGYPSDRIFCDLQQFGGDGENYFNYYAIGF